MTNLIFFPRGRLCLTNFTFPPLLCVSLSVSPRFFPSNLQHVGT